MRLLKKIGWRGTLAACLLLVAVATAVASPHLGSRRAHARLTSSPASLSSTSLRTRFDDLSEQHSNRCGMPASALAVMAPNARLQGACCFPMNYDSYVKQGHEIARYADVSVVPQDPYDISAILAKRLAAYQSIKLTAVQQRVYDHAKPLSTTKGPCCCRCWRWTAFGGQAKYLITRRQYTARQIADVWSVEEGCGGPSGS